MAVNPISNASTSSSLIHPGFNDFFKWVNGKLEAKDKNNPTLFEKTNGLVLNTTKSVWGLYLPLQIIGLFNERATKLAKAFYGACWSIVYTSLRPFTPDRKTLGGNKATPLVKEAYNLNEYFRVGMGTVVSALYGGGAFGMLWGALTGDDKFFDKAAKVYSTGMFNQNQIFGSMNLEKLLSRKFNNNTEQLPAKVDQEQTGVKEKLEFLDAVLFIPNVIARGLDTVKLFGGELGEGLQRSINAFGKFSYGTWACRFGELKKKKSKEEDGSEYGGDLEPLNPDLKGIARSVDKALRDTQEKSAKAFQVVLPGLSWASSLLELVGLHELSEKVFKWEGILERLHPTIAAWCIRNPILNLFKKVENNQQEIRKEVEQNIETLVEEKDEPVILKFVPKIAEVKRDEIEPTQVTGKESNDEMKASFDTSRLPAIVRFLRDSVQDGTDVRPEEVLAAADQELIEWEDVISACGKGNIPLSFVVENPELFPGEIYDQATSGAYFADKVGKNHLSQYSVAIDGNTYPAVKLFLMGRPIKDNVTLSMEHFYTAAQGGWVSWRDIISAAKEGTIPWNDFLDGVAEGRIPYNAIVDNRDIFDDEPYKFTEVERLARSVMQNTASISPGYTAVA